MAKLQLSIAMGDYDRTRALFDGARADRRRRSGLHDCSIRRRCSSARCAASTSTSASCRSPATWSSIRGRVPVHRGAGVPVARLPPHLDLRAQGPHPPAGGPEGQARRPARVPAHRQRLGARDAAGRLRREAAGRHLGARRHRHAGPAGEDQAAAARRRARSRARPRARRSPQLLDRGDIDGFIAPRPPSARGAAQPERRLAVRRSDRRRQGLLPPHRRVSDHACRRRSARSWPRSIRGCRARSLKAFTQAKAHALERLATPRRPR